MINQPSSDPVSRKPAIAGWLLLLAFLLLTCRDAGAAGGMLITGAGGAFQVPVRSFKESFFHNVVKQQFDFSCGSAALATLLTYHYGQPVSEQDVFQAMYQEGDKESIQKNGFSLLDMKKYLQTRGYLANGYEIPLDAFVDLGIPAITLINKNNYRHFVVVKGVHKDQVLIGDPAIGIRVMPRAEFEPAYNGVFFLILNAAEIGSQRFNQQQEWLAWRRSPKDMAVDRAALSSFSLSLPRAGDF